MRKTVIGILAGMGPMSTAPFIDMLMKEWQNEFKVIADIDFPHVLIYSLPTPFYVDRPLNHNLMKTTIVKGLSKLQAYGVDFIAMPCNTAHRYYEYLQKTLHIKILNIVEVTCSRIPEKVKNIAILATESTIECGIYQGHLKNNGKKLIYDKNLQEIVNNLINNIKGNANPQVIHVYMSKLITFIKQNKAEAIVVACTDISLVVKEYIPDQILVIDSSRCLAQSIIKEYKDREN